jgi:hypothetical protein
MKTTREGKPFCPNHVEHHAYVQAILRILSDREEERDRVRRLGPGEVDISGPSNASPASSSSSRW